MSRLLRLLPMLVFLLAPAQASAVELYWSPDQVVTQPQVVVVHPVTQYVLRPPVVTTQVSTQYVVETPIVQPVAARRDPYATRGMIVVGGGAGAMFVFGDGITNVVPAYRLHLGIALDSAEFALRAELAPDAGSVPRTGGGTTPNALYNVGASFNYRFLPDADVHPVLGAGVTAVIADPHEAPSGVAFAVTGRAGIELAFAIDAGAVAFGIDVVGHHVVGAQQGFPGAASDMITTTAYGDYRF